MRLLWFVTLVVTHSERFKFNEPKAQEEKHPSGIYYKDPSDSECDNDAQDSN